MRVASYKYIAPNSGGIVESIDRSAYMTTQYVEMLEEYLGSIHLKGRCAVLYAGGVLLSSSEARNVNDDGELRENVQWSGLAIRELASYSMHKWIGAVNGREYIRYANINGNTCASSMYSLYEAEQLLKQGFDQVLIIAEEKTSYNTMRIFKEMSIDLKIGEGCAVMLLEGGDGISDCKWSYEWNRNPFGVTESGYKEVVTECDYINPHGTGTPNNESAEAFYDTNIPQLRYKWQYGHTMGVSGLLEVCMVLDEENIKGNVLCVSSGLGGFYGSCIIQK